MKGRFLAVQYVALRDLCSNYGRITGNSLAVANEAVSELQKRLVQPEASLGGARRGDSQPQASCTCQDLAATADTRHLSSMPHCPLARTITRWVAAMNSRGYIGFIFS